jgi:NADH-quinone oxidoreductase subunit E
MMCVASCGSAPVVLINDTYHERVNPEQLDALLETLT